MEIKTLKGQQLIESGWAERIIAFDKANMEDVLNNAGIPFPEENRLSGFRNDPTFIVAVEGDAIAGYLQYTRSWTDPRYIYLASLQIAPSHRHTKVIVEILSEFIDVVDKEDFLGFETNVQKTNITAVRMYKKIGFKLEENPRNQASWQGRVDRGILKTSPVRRLIEDWRQKSGERHDGNR